jgi:DNA repair protein RadC
MTELLKKPKPRIMDFQSSCHQWTQSQLLSYVLNGASRYQNVDDMAAEFSNQFKSLSHLMQMDEKALCSIKGIGPTKAKQIMAMLALHRAWNAPQELPQSIKKSGDAMPHFYALQALSHEEFHVLYLNRAHVPLTCQQLFKGGITGTVTDVRVVMKKALQWGATAMIVAHNHPSGALYPSENDKRMTKKLVSAAKTLDLTVLDHLIVTRSGYFSFSDQGLM